MKHRLRWLLAAVLGVALVVLADPEELVGKEAPAVKLKTVDNKDFDLAKVEEDLIVFDFWASWCGPCRRGLPELQKFADWAKQEEKSIAVYTINLREDAEKVNKAWEELGMKLPVLMDTDGGIARKYLVEGIPTCVAISGGKVVGVHVGYSDHYLADLKEWGEQYGG